MNQFNNFTTQDRFFTNQQKETLIKLICFYTNLSEKRALKAIHRYENTVEFCLKHKNFTLEDKLKGNAKTVHLLLKNYENYLLEYRKFKFMVSAVKLLIIIYLLEKKAYLHKQKE